MNIEDIQKKHGPAFRALMAELTEDLNQYAQEHNPSLLEVDTVVEVMTHHDPSGVGVMILADARLEITVSL